MGEPRTILVVDDNESDRELLSAALAKYVALGRVVVARDGGEALEWLQGRGPDAGPGLALPVMIVLDLDMPVVDGLTALRSIKSDGRLSGTPVVVLTSSLRESDRAECYARGASSFVVKPIEHQHFVATVQHLGNYWTGLNQT